MDTELRAPDPTLAAYHQSEGECVDVSVSNPYDHKPTAHRIVGPSKTACGLTWGYTHPAFLACWVAVPCRRCFGEAPDPGHRYIPDAEEPDMLDQDLDPALAWQLAHNADPA